MNADRAGEDALLELLNTTPVVEGAVRDALGGPADGRAWAREHGGTGADEEVALLVAARDALQDVVRGRRDPECLNEFLAGVGSVPHIAGGGLEWVLQVPDARRLTVELVLTWARVEESRPGRLKPCGNPECRRFLLDRSKPNSARWCSMAECGNRMKARRHYRRAREAGAR
ncbi:CGNR zinc finger domain-containing protein [Streptomyces sp. NPDC057245]|uniref:CGNR zinc finger domain-containing protein n=1 Tax=Streptomyces TaxID=1883 RepID=UPI001C1E72B2|nr:CGNR zinc finger domain-containing protein [Streptomyces sp. A108]MBU6531477.1 CGNR zinc finger domain-containing protein [Streptomyces sp. A108]